MRPHPEPCPPKYCSPNHLFIDIYVSFIEAIEHQIPVINGSKTSRADYDKLFSAHCMEVDGIPTPKTIPVKTLSDAKAAAEVLGFPLICKPILGGRSLGVLRIESPEDFSKVILSANKYYNNTILFQKFIPSTLPIDYRVCFCGGSLLYAHSRTLMDGWIGSRSMGSKIDFLDIVPEEVVSICLNATKSIGAYLNVMDVIVGPDGPVIIENNPTPNFRSEYIEILGFNPVEKIVKKILEDYSERMVMANEANSVG